MTPVARSVGALLLLVVALPAGAQLPSPNDPVPQPPQPRRPAVRQPLTEGIGHGQLIEADEKHIVLRVPVNAGQPDGDTQDQRVDRAEGETLRLTVDGEPATPADLKLPMTADVMRFRGGGRMQPSLTVMVRTPSVGGTLTAVSLPTLTMTSGRDRTPVTVTTDDKTRVMVFAPVAGRPSARVGKTAALSDLKPGMLLDVHPPTGVATFISATVPIDPAEIAAATRPLNDERDVGVIEKIDATTLHLRSNQNGAVNVEADGQTRVSIDGRVATLAELKPEMDVTVSRRTGNLRPGEPSLRVMARSPQVYGRIKSFDGNTLTILQQHQLSPPSDLSVTLGEGVTVETFPDYPENAKPGTRADLVEGREALFVNRNGTLATVRVFTGTPATQPTTAP